MKLFKTIYPYFYILWVAIVIGCILSWDYVITMPFFWICVAFSAVVGSFMGMTYLMISEKAWK